jgi:hypothetical protein
VRARVLARFLTLCLVSLSSTPVVIPRCEMRLVYALGTAFLHVNSSSLLIEFIID